MFRTLLSVVVAMSIASLSLAQTAAPKGDKKAPAEAKPAKKAPAKKPAYDPVAERAKFFKIAGKDTEVDAKEFAAALAKVGDKGEGFVRKTDKWSALLKYDKNKNSKIDWFEADAYRRSLRSGRRSSPMGSMGIFGLGASANTTKYDKDGDGKLSEEERRAMRKDSGGTMGAAVERWRLQHFDLDGDGKLSEAEEAEHKEFQGQFEAMGKALDVKFNDLDGDGEVSIEERRKIAQEWRKSGFQMMMLITTYMDRDGDGQISAEEGEGFGKRIQTGIVKWMEDFNKKFDADTNGRLDKTERGAFLVGLQKSIETRIKRFDANEDGRLAPPEAIELIKDFAKEIDLVPPKPKDLDKTDGKKN